MKNSFNKITAILLTVALLFSLSSCSADTVRADNEQDIADYLETLGWTCSDEAIEILNIVIPSQFSEVYQNYNELQRQSGFDLSHYMGDDAVRYTYIITNYPAADGGFEKDVRANVITVGGIIVGGDISSTKLDGFMQPLAKRS